MLDESQMKLLEKLCGGKPSEQTKAFVEHFVTIAERIGGPPQPALIALAVAYSTPVFTKQEKTVEAEVPAFVPAPKPETVTAKKGVFKRGT